MPRKGLQNQYKSMFSFGKKKKQEKKKRSVTAN